MAVADAGRRVRTEAIRKIRGGLRGLYRTLEQPGKHPLKDAHADLDRAVLDAYGFSSEKDLLGQLLELNQTLAKRQDNEQPTVAPDIPPQNDDPSLLFTDDRIEA